MSQPTTTVEVCFDQTVAFGALNFNTVAFGSQLWASQRWLNFANCYLEATVLSIKCVPVGLTSAQFVAYAMYPTHLPVLVATQDTVPAVPSNIAQVLAIPGGQQCQQGNSLPRLSTVSVPQPRYAACSTLTSEAPYIAFLTGYSTANVKFAAIATIHFRGYQAD
jgi:hypothetical protein